MVRNYDAEVAGSLGSAILMPSFNSTFKSLRGGVKWGSINSASLIISKILRGVLIPKLLDPVNYGLFSSIGIFSRYLQFSDFGTSAWFIKEFPRVHYEMEAGEQQALINSAFTLIVFSFSLVIIYLTCAAVLVEGESVDFYVSALLLLIPITIISKVREFFINYSIAIQDYGKGSRVIIANNYISLLFVTAGVGFFGAIGGVVAMLLTEVISVFYALATIRLKVSIIWGIEVFREWRQISKQFILSITDVMAATIDQILILWAFDAATLGCYLLGMTFGWVFEAISEVFNTASYPKLMAIAKSARTQAIVLLNQTIYCFLLGALVALPIVLIGMEVLINFYLTAYKSGLAVYAIMLGLGMLRGITTLLRRGYIACDMEKAYVKYTTIAIAIYAMSMIAAVVLNQSFEHLVAMIVVLYFLRTTTFYFLLVRVISADVVRNFWLIVVSLFVLAGYQYGIYAVEGESSATDALVFSGVMLVISSAYAYRKRAVIFDYIR